MRTAVIPAGGTGRRMLPLTSTIPKPLLPIGMRATLHYIVEECVLSGIERVGLVTKYRAADIREYFESNRFIEFADIELEFIPQGEGWGMADAIMNAEEFVGGEQFAVLLADDIVRSGVPAVKQMMDVSESDYVIGCEKVPLSQVHRYGAVVPDVQGTDIFRACRIVEKPQPPQVTDIVVAGRYLLRSKVFDILGAMEDGHTSLTDALAIELESGEAVLCRILNGIRYDVGSPDGYRRAFVASVEEGWR